MKIYFKDKEIEEFEKEIKELEQELNHIQGMLLNKGIY